MAAALPDAPLRVVNLGLALFAGTLTAEGVAVVHVDWRPPVGGAAVASMLAALVEETG